MTELLAHGGDPPPSRLSEANARLHRHSRALAIAGLTLVALLVVTFFVLGRLVDRVHSPDRLAQSYADAVLDGNLGAVARLPGVQLPPGAELPAGALQAALPEGTTAKVTRFFFGASPGPPTELPAETYQIAFSDSSGNALHTDLVYLTSVRRTWGGIWPYRSWRISVGLPTIHLWRGLMSSSPLVNGVAVPPQPVWIALPGRYRVEIPPASPLLAAIDTEGSVWGTDKTVWRVGAPEPQVSVRIVRRARGLALAALRQHAASLSGFRESRTRVNGTPGPSGVVIHASLGRNPTEVLRSGSVRLSWVAVMTATLTHADGTRHVVTNDGLAQVMISWQAGHPGFRVHLLVTIHSDVVT